MAFQKDWEREREEGGWGGPNLDRFDARLTSFRFTCLNRFYGYAIDARPWRIFRRFRQGEEKRRRDFLAGMGYRYYLIEAGRLTSLKRVQKEIRHLWSSKPLPKGMQASPLKQEKPRVERKKSFSVSKKEVELMARRMGKSPQKIYFWLLAEVQRKERAAV
jgi:hypothetical protein